MMNDMNNDTMIDSMSMDMLDNMNMSDTLNVTDNMAVSICLTKF